MIYGEHLLNYYWYPKNLWHLKDEPLEATKATLAWRGPALGLDNPELGGLRLFKATWANPQPDLEIASLEFQTGDNGVKPFVVAITAE